MGNFCSSSGGGGGASKPKEAAAISPVVVQSHPPQKYSLATVIADKDQSTRTKTSSSSSTAATPYPGGTLTPDAMEPETETHFPNQSLDQIKLVDLAAVETGKNSTSTDEKEEIELDPRVIHLLEFIRQMYVRKEDLFRKVINPVRKEELIRMFTKMGKAKEQGINRRHHVLLMRRSFSIGATTSRGVDLGNGDEMKLERFKVKTLDLPPAGSGGGGGTKLGGGSK